jgi:hypothetical protein
LKKTEPFRDCARSDLSLPFYTIQKQARENGCTFTDKLRETTERQARPQQFAGATVLVFPGEEPTKEDNDAERGFPHGSSRASHLTRKILHRLLEIERTNQRDNRENRAYRLCEAFPFINSLPLPGYQNIEQALALLQQCFHCVRPIFVASFGQKAADVAQANFTGVRVRTSYQYTPLTLMAGNLALKSYGPSDEDAFIHIPLIHPARFNYSRQTPVELRFFYISLQFTFCVASQAMNVLKEHVAMGSTASRKMLCLDIIQEIARVLKTKDGLTFTSNMQQARFELNQHWGTLEPAEVVARKQAKSKHNWNQGWSNERYQHELDRKKSYREQVAKPIEQMKEDKKSHKETPRSSTKSAQSSPGVVSPASEIPTLIISNPPHKPLQLLPKRSPWGQPFPLKISLPELSSQPLVLKWRVNEGSGVRTRLLTSSSTDSSQIQPPPGQQSLDRSPSSPSSAPLFLQWSVHGDEAAQKRRKLGP